MSEEARQDNAVSQNGLLLLATVDNLLTYASYHNGLPLVEEVVFKNTSEEDRKELMLTITASGGIAENFSVGIAELKAGEAYRVKAPEVLVNGTVLANLTERITCMVTVAIKQGEEVLVEQKTNVVVLAYDQWPGLIYTPELLAAFAMPNHPVVTSFVQLASSYLEKWTKDPALAGYQYEDPNRVKDMAAAAYAAIQQKNITYAKPPSSFEQFGQRVRLPDAVMDQHLGTCMDMTLLYVAVLEAMGLNPFLVLMNGHIFAGVWLVENSFTDMITDDPTQLEKRMSRGIHELLVVECTAMCSGRSVDFDQAMAAAERTVSDYANFQFVIDVKRARSMGIRPLPVRIQQGTGFEVAHSERKQKEVTQASKESFDSFDIPQTGVKETVTKQGQWERKLLDLSLRNMLINMRLTSAVVPLLSPDVSILEDALADGEEFNVLPRPKEMSIVGDDGVSVEALCDLGPFKDFIQLESQHKRLHSLYSEAQLNKCMTKMYRSAKTSLEENGASTLYLTLGLLRWFEGKKDTTPRYAPIVLVPISVERKSASKGFALYMRDEDAQINITLLEFLKQNYNTQVMGLNPPPMDEHGLDLPRIFATIRHAIMNLPLWDVVEVGFIGNFSFSQFMMWNDIHANGDFLSNSPIVRSLMNGAVDWDCTLPEDLDNADAYLPVPVDASQLRAVNMAAADVSFVLHGPPGTGKSQTITAMIANALTKGKSVLFVAEKMAALEVVERRLTALGIGDFCLELHSTKATKKSVLDQLKQVLSLEAQTHSENYARRIEDMRKLRHELDDYARALHLQRPFGRSVREMIDAYEMLSETEQSVRFDHSYVAGLTDRDLDRHKSNLERLVAAGQGIGHPKNHPLKAVHATAYSQSIKFELDDIVTRYLEALDALDASGAQMVQLLGAEAPQTQAQWQKLIELAQTLMMTEHIPDFLRHATDVDQAFAEVQLVLEKRTALSEKQAEMQEKWNENFLKLEMQAFRDKYDAANKKFFGKGKALGALTTELQAYANFDVATEQIPVYLTDVDFYQKEQEELAALEDGLSAEWQAVLAQYPDVSSFAGYQAQVKQELGAAARYSTQLDALSEAGQLTAARQQAQQLVQHLTEVQTEEQRLMDLLQLQFDAEGNMLEERRQLCNCIRENADAIKDWMLYRQFDDACRADGLGVLCDAYAQGMAHHQVIPVYLRSIYRDLILSVIEQESVLNRFTGTDFNARIQQFKKLDQDFMEATKAEVYDVLSRQLPTPSESVEISKELNILRRAIASNGRGISIRSLFDQIPNVLRRLCPCMLMSPMSVSQYLKPENNLVDIVMFDEASQLPTCKAVGVLARGRNAIVVGDPNQMPPTSFFAGNTVDEDNLDIEDLDSILDDCLALGMPQTHLHWHYRSRHESLIAFSNQEFYENSMLTFPSKNDRERRVSLKRVNGFFDRGKGRVNRGEAEAIVAEIRRRYDNPSTNGQSIGVVTFNISQQNLIEDLLQEAFMKDEAFDRWANNSEDPLFVKNLENVQGDERDVILFSVAFGPDAAGKMSMNFGPINKNGGWKRLNVAVSRARYEMVVFTTLTSNMIDLRRTKARGVEALRNFLEYAEKGKLVGAEYEDTQQKKVQGILAHLCETIRAEGFEYQTSVGHSKFKIDIAVVNPFDTDEYLLGIMLDGDAYRDAENTRDREVSQAGVLGGLGWKLHRVWAMDWWDNSEREIRKLLGRLDEEKRIAHDEFFEKYPNGVKPVEEEVVIPVEVTEPELMVDEVAEEIVEETIEETVEEAVEETVVEAAEDVEIEVVSVVEKDDATTVEAEPQQYASVLVEEKASPSLADQSPKSTENTVDYALADYVQAEVNVPVFNTIEFVQKENLPLIVDVMQTILDAEAPIAYDRWLKRTLRSFGIPRTSTNTVETFDKAMKKVSSRANKQGDVKFYWRKEQVFEEYRLYRREDGSSDKRSVDEITQQELKNAVCLTLKEQGPLNKGVLIKETIRTMGYTRRSPALIEAIERGIKYARRSGEVVQTDDKNLTLG